MPVVSHQHFQLFNVLWICERITQLLLHVHVRPILITINRYRWWFIDEVSLKSLAAEVDFPRRFLATYWKTTYRLFHMFVLSTERDQILMFDPDVESLVRLQLVWLEFIIHAAIS